jgi:hypothetical protein
MGPNNFPINQTFNMTSLFFEKKDVKVPEYQEKLCVFKMYGLSFPDKKLVMLGEKEIDVSLYVNRVGHSL